MCIIGYMWGVIGGSGGWFIWGYGGIMGMRLVGLFWGNSVESGFDGYGWVF